jgi:hypothetical protein
MGSNRRQSPPKRQWRCNGRPVLVFFAGFCIFHISSKNDFTLHTPFRADNLSLMKLPSVD